MAKTVPYGLDRRHSAACASGEKTRTIRRIGGRAHARPGDWVRIYEGLRTKACRLVVEGECVSARPVELRFSDSGALSGGLEDGRHITDPDAFARLDGFADAFDMGRFFAALHGPGTFYGVLIEWTPNEDRGSQPLL